GYAAPAAPAANEWTGHLKPAAPPRAAHRCLTDRPAGADLYCPVSPAAVSGEHRGLRASTGAVARGLHLLHIGDHDHGRLRRYRPAQRIARPQALQLRPDVLRHLPDRGAVLAADQFPAERLGGA